MRVPRPWSTTLVLLCLLVLQAQVLASATLGCSHFGGPEQADAGACPFHQQDPHTRSAIDPPPEAALECQKCALHCGIGTPVEGVASAQAPASWHEAEQPAAIQRHFYRFDPEPSLKPPISRLL